MRKSSLWVAALVCMGLMGSAAVAAEMVDNPVYVSWSKHKPGTSVTYKSETETKMEGAPAMKNEMTMTSKLLEVTPEAVTVETQMTMTMNGQEMKQPAQKQTHKAKVEKGKEIPAPEGAEIKDMKEGTDKVEVAGKSYDAKTKEYTMVMKQPMEMTAQNKIWTSDSVPGTMLKMESTSSGAMASTTKMTLVDFKTEK